MNSHILCLVFLILVTVVTSFIIKRKKRKERKLILRPTGFAALAWRRTMLTQHSS